MGLKLQALIEEKQCQDYMEQRGSISMGTLTMNVTTTKTARKTSTSTLLELLSPCCRADTVCVGVRNDCTVQCKRCGLGGAGPASTMIVYRVDDPQTCLSGLGVSSRHVDRLMAASLVREWAEWASEPLAAEIIAVELWDQVERHIGTFIERYDALWGVKRSITHPTSDTSCARESHRV